ncbi:mitochondrial calcium uniporter regulator 1 [Lepisosteus oculatus]|uniref:mitochondrial calcium uniporter regulator 1 n=1 Tax=Lepisosteus oculatus TaxID=7918 RepID=UPI0037170DDD
MQLKRRWKCIILNTRRGYLGKNFALTASDVTPSTAFRRLGTGQCVLPAFPSGVASGRGRGHSEWWTLPCVGVDPWKGRSVSCPGEASVSRSAATMLRLTSTGRLRCSGRTDRRNRPWHKTDIFARVETALSFFKRTRLLVRELNTSIKVFQYDLKNVEAAKSESRKFYFDTHAVVRLLEEKGFSTEQAEVLVTALIKITNSNMDVIYKDMVTKVQQEIMLQKVMSHIAAVKKDMIILEKSEFSALLVENEKLKLELQQLKIQAADEMNKIRSDAILELNIEKSRVKEMYADHERKLLELRTETVEMHSEQDRAVTQTIMKIDTEVAGLKTMLESHKLDTIKYLAGSVFTCLTVALGFYRVWM